MLSPRTAYGAYLITKLADRAYGLDSLPSEVSLEVGNFKSERTFYIRNMVIIKNGTLAYLSSY